MTRPTWIARALVAMTLTAVSVPRLLAQVPAGGEFEVSPGGASPSVATDSSGNFVVVWKDQDDGDIAGVSARRYDASGAPLGAEFQVNSYTTGYQGSWPGPRVASDAAGNFVVVWASVPCCNVPLQDGSGAGIFAQRYDASGSPRGSEFRVNTYTTGDQGRPSATSDAAGNFVVVWASGAPYWITSDVFAQRFDAAGAPRGSEFQVNTYPAHFSTLPSLASDGAGNFVVAWTGYGQDGEWEGVFAQRFDATGARRGTEFQVNTYTTASQSQPSVASHADGGFVVAWSSQDGDYWGVLARRYDPSGVPLGAEFQVNSSTAGSQTYPCVASDNAGGFVVAWQSVADPELPWGSYVFARRYDASGAPRGLEFQVNTSGYYGQRPSTASDASGNFVVAWDRSGGAIAAQRFGGVAPAPSAVDPQSSPGSDGNGVLEPGETAVAVAPAWRNVNGQTRTFDGVGVSLGGPSAAGVSYQLQDAVGAYGAVPNGSTAPCSDCYQVGVTFGHTRPSLHWDATFTERLTPDTLGQTKLWPLHVGESFADVPKTSSYYRFVETLLHKGVTGGCSATDYCPASAVTREQMAVFALVGKQGVGYLPSACSPGYEAFADVPASSPFCRYVEDLSRRGVVSGCGDGNYCPGGAVTREQMPVFVLKTLDPAIDPPACTTPLFADVPASSPYCRFIAELVRRGVVSGCGGGNYCPGEPVTREQMAVFISQTFGLSLYGP